MGQGDGYYINHAQSCFEKSISKGCKTNGKRGKDLHVLKAVVTLLTDDGVLPFHFRPHKLSGEYEGLWECHVENDWLLIYDVSAMEVLLIRTGSHDDLF